MEFSSQIYCYQDIKTFERSPNIFVRHVTSLSTSTKLDGKSPPLLLSSLQYPIISTYFLFKEALITTPYSDSTPQPNLHQPPPTISQNDIDVLSYRGNPSKACSRPTLQINSQRHHNLEKVHPRPGRQQGQHGDRPQLARRYQRNRMWNRRRRPGNCPGNRRSDECVQALPAL